MIRGSTPKEKVNGSKIMGRNTCRHIRPGLKKKGRQVRNAEKVYVKTDYATYFGHSVPKKQVTTEESKGTFLSSSKKVD